MPSITPISDDFVAEVTGINIVNATSSDTFAQIRAALDKYAVLVLPDQCITEGEQLNFARQFGPLETSISVSVYNAGNPRRLENPELADISNLDEQGAILANNDIRRVINLSNQLWHTDSSFRETPASVSLLSAQEIPPVGGATEFADMRAAWDKLPAKQRESLVDLIAEHDFFHSRMLTGFGVDQVSQEWRQLLPPVPQVLVRTHPVSGRKSLYLASHISRVLDMEAEESQQLVSCLMAFATQPEFVYRHRWRTNDIVIWDNRCTMHRGRTFDEKYRRAMRRATVQDIGPTTPVK